MSWWRSVEATRPSGLFTRLRPGLEETAAPATLLRIPPVLTVRRAGRLTPPANVPAVSLDQRSRGFSAGTPDHQLGYVLIWQQESVDLRGIFLKLLPPFPEKLRKESETDDVGDLREHTEREHDNLALRLAAILVPPPESFLRAYGPLEWPASFFPYQLDGIRTLLHSSHLLLGDEMGLGKTIQAIAALRILLHAREIEQALIVTPAGVLEQWRREILLWAPELRVMTITGPADQRTWQWQYRAHLSLVSYDTLRADFSSSATCGPRRTKWSVVVLDEAQKIKNRQTDVSRMCKRLPRFRSWALTGTPLENSTEDVVSILEFVAGGSDPSPAPASRISLRSSLGAFQLRRKKAEVLQDLPPKIVTKLLLPLTPAQRAAYDRAESEGLVVLRTGQEIPIESVLALINRLKQICNFAPAPSPADPGSSSKIDDLVGRLEELSAGGQKALVFTQYTNNATGARQIAARLERFDPLLYTGDMNLSRRHEVIDRFRESDRHKVLILSLKSGGQGLNLQCASYVFHFDRGWNPATERQAEDRAHRLGQTVPVHVYRYIMEDTIEQRIEEILNSKVELFEAIVDGATLDPTHLLTRQDLLDLMGV